MSNLFYMNEITHNVYNRCHSDNKIEKSFFSYLIYVIIEIGRYKKKFPPEV